MKKTIIIMALAALLTALCSCEKEKTITATEKIIPATDLPAISLAFITEHFPEAEIIRVEKEVEAFSVDYTVYLSNGFEIDFLQSGDWDDIDGHRTALPESILNLLPKGILEYVTHSLSGQPYVVEVNKEHYGYEIGLNNGMELLFDAQGNFLRFDD
jgi:hypothetical protein